MEKKITELISQNLNITENQTSNTVKLLNDGCTIPFISRYRKEVTESLDEIQVSNIRDLYEKYIELDKRKETVLNTIQEQGKLTNELKTAILNCYDSIELEDIYLPYKPKKKTKATIAKEKGLEGLAKLIMKQGWIDPKMEAEKFLSDDVESIDDALQGARDIIAEWVNENKYSRNKIRYLFKKEALLTSKVSKGKEEEGDKYKDYFDTNQALDRISSHRLLAILRGEKEGFLKVSIEPDFDNAIDLLKQNFVKEENDAGKQVELAIIDSYKRLLKPSLETENRNEAKEKADITAINVFVENLRQLLLSPPLGQKNVLAVDPGFRTGCKVVCLDQYGNLLHNETIYPHPPQNETKQAIKKITSLINAYKIEAIAIGNGTASRETENLFRRMKFETDVKVVLVDESGASIYSASSLAREEFPQYDVTVRGSVSIGRRLMDPLAELVKIDPKSIGVGQYQHDVDQKLLKSSLDDTVESCVNSVGVELNTASKHLLNYVSGLGPQLAENIIKFRKEIGGFKSRKQLKEVKRMGDKAFEQCAGFLRIKNAENILDKTAVHPESYHVVKEMAKKMNCSVDELVNDKAIRANINLKEFISNKIGLPTLNDIMKELDKPGRDPRSSIKMLQFDENVKKIEDLISGMILPGIVTNVTNFGAFVDIGIKQKGLVHISNLSNSYVSDPTTVVKLHQHVKVKVLSVEIERKRIQLSMKDV
jgi:protein Tex